MAAVLEVEPNFYKERAENLQKDLEAAERAATTAQDWLHEKVCRLQDERRKSRRLTRELQETRDFLVKEAKRADALELQVKQLEARLAFARECLSDEGVILLSDEEDPLPDWVPSTPPTGITPYYQRRKDS
jgi:F0F1-type ATP synthase membrane subunit b/b'